METVDMKQLQNLLQSKSVHPLPYKNQPVIIYGAGQMGEASSYYLKKANVKIDCFLDKNPKMEGKCLNDIPVIHPECLSSEQKEGCLFAVGIIKIPYNEISDYLISLGCKNICYIGHLIEQTYKKPSIANVWYFDDMTQDEKKSLEFVFDNYTDDTSRRALLQLLYWIILGKEQVYQTAVGSPESKYFISNVLEVLSKEEVFIDCGAYNGSSIEKIEKFTKGQYKAIHSFEPEPDNYQLLLSAYSNNNRVFTYNFGLGSENKERNFTTGMGLTSRFTAGSAGSPIPMRKLDDVMGDLPYSFMKVYGLGIGWEVIKGSLKGIIKNRSIIAINIHHSRKDFVKIPQILMCNLTNYNFCLRLHGYCGSEAVLYAIPKERYERS